MEIIGCASKAGGHHSNCDKGVLVLAKSARELGIKWVDTLLELTDADWSIEQVVAELNTRLALSIKQQIATGKKPMVIGGEHTCAVGTWSGVQSAYADQGDIGLIWIDAHMDSHTPQTSLSQHLHGMPLAALLGYGYPSLTGILHSAPKLLPRNLCLIGVRSFEEGEAVLLKKLNVKVYFIDEVLQRGFMNVLQEAIASVSVNTCGFGVSLDLDSIDPQDAPAVDVPEANGIRAHDVLVGLEKVAQDKRLLAVEIVEFDPMHDIDHKTEKLVMKCLEIFAHV
jgi:arginase